MFRSSSLKNKHFQRWRTSYPYPQNLARNVARKGTLDIIFFCFVFFLLSNFFLFLGANTNFTFVTDVDIVPSPNSAKELSTFLKSNACNKCAYVTATYELHASAEFPKNKTDLLTLVKKKKARPFHQTVFQMNQFATNFSE